MRPNTSESGILSTKRKRPVSTSMLTRMLVPNPKNAFQSPGVQIAPRVQMSGRYSADFESALDIGGSLDLRARCGSPRHLASPEARNGATLREAMLRLGPGGL